MRYRFLPASRPAFALTVLLVVLVVYAAPFFSGTAEARWTYMEQRQRGLESKEARLAAIKSVSAMEEPDENGLNRLVVASFRLALDEPDKEIRAGYWKSALSFIYKLEDVKKTQIDFTITSLLQLLLAMQENPGEPVALYRERIEKRLREHGYAPGMTFADYNRATGYLLDFELAVPADIRSDFYRAVFNLTGLNISDKEGGASSGFGSELRTMFRCLAELPEAEQPALLDKTYTLLEAYVSEYKNREGRNSLQSAYLGMALVDFVRLARVSVDNFNLHAMLSRDDDTSVLRLVSEAQAGIEAGTPDAQQQALIARATSNLCRAYSGSDYGRHYTESLKTRLVSMLMARFPGNVKLTAGYALALSDGWDSSDRRYSKSSYSRSYEGLPPVSELVAQAEALDPEDLVLLKTKLIVNYQSYSSNTGGALAGEIFLNFRINCLESVGDDPGEAWFAWNDYGMGYGMDSVDIGKLVGNFEAFGKRCPAFRSFAEFKLRDAAHQRRREPDKEAEYVKSQISLLEKALSHNPPAGAASILYARLGELKTPNSYGNDLSELEKAAALESAIKDYENALGFWQGHKKAFPWNKQLAELYTRSVANAESRLNAEFLEKIKTFNRENIWKEGDDPELAWANYLFGQADSYTLRKTPERAEFLRQQGFTAYRTVNQERLGETDWTAWARRLEQQAEREHKLLEADVLQDIHDKLERALAFNPLGVGSNTLLSQMAMTIMAGTPESEWGDLAGKAYARFALSSGLPPAGARAFSTWSRALHLAAAKVEEYELAAEKNDQARSRRESIRAVRLLAERFAAAALKPAGERRAFLAALYPGALEGVPVARPIPEAPAGSRYASGNPYAFRAEILPKLIRAGFSVPDDFQALTPAGQSLQSYYYRTDNSVLTSFAEALEAFRAFPQTGARLEAVLFDESLPRVLRAKWLSAVTPALAKLSLKLIDSRSYSSSYNKNDIKQEMAAWYDSDLNARDDDQLSGEELLAAADFLLARYLDFIEEESPIGFIAWAGREKRPHVRAWPENVLGSSWGFAGDMDIQHQAESTAELLVRHWHNDQFRIKAVELLDSGKGLPADRLQALYIISVSPSENIDDALASAPYSSGISSFASCWDWMRDSFSYGLTPGNCGDNLLEVMNQKARSGPGIVSAAQQGPGIGLRKLDGPPVDFSGHGPLYLLYVGRSALPEWLRPRAADGYNALAGTLLVGMDGPRIVPVDPATDDGAVLLNWAASVGAPAGEAIIIASADDPPALAKRIASWHLSFWEEEPGEASFVFNKPCNGSFLRAHLPVMKGQAAALFMGHERAIWFASPAVGGVDWYLAEPEPGLEPLPASSLPYSLEISHGHIMAAGKVFSEDYPVYYSNQLAFEKTKPGRDAVFARNFYAETDRKLINSPATRSMDRRERQRAIEVLWSALGQARERKVEQAMFAASPDLKPGERINQARKALEGEN